MQQMPVLWDGDASMRDVWNEAIDNAVKAFKQTFEDASFDGAYWTIEIISHSLDSNMGSILETKRYDELGNYNLQRTLGCIKETKDE